MNHHETTLSVAGYLTDETFAGLTQRMQIVRTKRADVEYAWTQTITADDMDEAVRCAGEMIERANAHLKRIGFTVD
jgi:hypothetical protein